MTLLENAPLVLSENKKADAWYQLLLHAKISLHNFDKKIRNYFSLEVLK